MVFRIRERESDVEAEWIAEWPFPPRPHFIESRAYELLLREMGRYVRGEVPGRSFLISGHRGSGKTSLVRQSVEDLNRDLLDRAVKRAVKGTGSHPYDRERLLSLQRPLLVKLHGPSLLGPIRKPKPKPEPPKQPPKPEGAKEGKEGEKNGDATPPAAPATAAASAAPKVEEASTDPTAFALEQITIGLYRALTTEFGKSFTNHAREMLASNSGGAAKDYLELAAQFTLDLDNAPRPVLLRSYYERLGRIQAGVLWPYEIGEHLLRPGLNDQGAREIVALATAAQAFEVCSGEITDKQVRKEAQSRDESTDTKVEAGLKDVANKILGLAAGVLVGFGSANWLGWSAGAAAGVATGLLSTLTLTWTSKRIRKDERTRDYTFIRRRDREALERDLPLVIQRVRDAGLAPVFVLDELDKLSDPKKSIADLINSLKHLTTDYGFFCFLTDRDYYDYVARELRERAFPIEHSFFSHRLFILPQPQDIQTYLGRITKSESSPAAEPAGAPAASADPYFLEEVARSTFGLVVLHRSKLNVIDVLRKIAEECDAQGRVRATPARLRADPGYRFEAGIQLIIGMMLQTEKLRGRVENEPRFMQRAIDALYMISRAWESEQDTVRLDRAAIVKCLLGRGGKVDAKPPAGDATDVPAPKPARQRSKDRAKRNAAAESDAEKAAREAAEKAKAEEAKAKEKAEEAAREVEENRKNESELLQGGMSLLDLKLIEEAVALLANLLSQTDRRTSWLATTLASWPEQTPLRGISLPGDLIVLADKDTRAYRFLVDEYGLNIETQAQVDAAQAASARTQGGAPSQPDPPRGASSPPPARDSSQQEGQPPAQATTAGEPMTESTLPPELGAQRDSAYAYFRGVESALTAGGIDLSDLVRLQVFPPNLDPAELTRAALRVEAARGQPYSELTKDLQLLQSLMTFVAENGFELSTLFQIALRVAQGAREPALRLAEAIAAIGRYVDLRAGGFMSPDLGVADVPFALFGAVRPSTDLASLEQWRRLLLDIKAQRAFPVFGENDRLGLWDAAAKSVHDHLIEGRPIVDPLSFQYLVGAAAGIAPASFMRRDLRRMTAADWSRLCLAGFPTGTDARAPLWCFVAGLRALGFGSRILTEACNLSFYFGGHDHIDLCKELAQSARQNSGPGYVLVMRDDGASVGEAVDYLRQHLAEKTITPPLALTEHELDEYNEGLAWLRARGAVTRVTYEEDD